MRRNAKIELIPTFVKTSQFMSVFILGPKLCVVCSDRPRTVLVFKLITNAGTINALYPNGMCIDDMREYQKSGLGVIIAKAIVVDWS